MDHNQIDLEINFENHKQGPGTWKFPNDLLYDPEWVELANSTIKEHFVEYRCKVGFENDPLTSLKGHHKYLPPEVFLIERLPPEI